MRAVEVIIGVALAFAMVPAAAADLFRGEWGGDCGQGVQCWVSLAPKAGGYNVQWVVADRMDAANVLCSIAGTASKSGSKSLKGTAADGREILISGGGASIRFTGITSNPCAGTTRPVEGDYVAIGD